MQTSEQDIDQAVLQIFTDLGAGDGDCLMLEDLRIDWSREHHHDRDLLVSVRRMIFGGLIDLGRIGSGRALRLTERGRQQASDCSRSLRSLRNSHHPVAMSATA